MKESFTQSPGNIDITKEQLHDDFLRIGKSAIDIAGKDRGLSDQEYSQSDAHEDHEEDHGHEKYRLGNPELPIYDFRKEIMKTVDENQITILTAETGAGKSTQVPQFLAEDGYKVIVTQPRILAARSVSERVRDEVKQNLGEGYDEFVGYRTAKERDDSPQNRILFVTDGLQMVRELSDEYKSEKTVLVLDEVHEWNTNMEVLAAWSNKKAQEDPSFKLVVMSATMESEPLSEFFSNEEGEKVPVIDVPGRTFPVTKREGNSVLEDAIKFAEEGKNTLVFVPGKAEINYLCEKLKKSVDAEVLPLHGELSPSEQRLVFKKYDKPKVIVSTNVAQTSVTIDDINAVVDSGLERQSVTKNNIKGLFLNPISQADCLQRAGRAGRVQEGEYVLSPLYIPRGSRFMQLPFWSMNERQEFPTPEILRNSLDSTALHLARAGFDIEDLDFFHQPNSQEIINAKKRLFNLGALDEQGKITKIGREMEKISLDPHLARMMVEARKYGDTVRRQMAGILAVQSVGGVHKDGIVKDRFGNEKVDPWEYFIKKRDNPSTLIQEYELFLAAHKMSNKEKRDNGILIKNFNKARETIYQIRKREYFSDDNLTMPNKKQTEQIIKCIVAGSADKVFSVDYYGDCYSMNDGMSYSYGYSNLANLRRCSLAVADPRIIQTRRGGELLLVENTTFLGEDYKSSYKLLKEVTPYLCSERENFCVKDGELNKITTFYFKDREIPFQEQQIVESMNGNPDLHQIMIDSTVKSLESGYDKDDAITVYDSIKDEYDHVSLGYLAKYDDHIINREEYANKARDIISSEIQDDDVSVEKLKQRVFDQLDPSNFISKESAQYIFDNYRTKLPVELSSDGEPLKWGSVCEFDNKNQRYLDYYSYGADSVKKNLLSGVLDCDECYKKIRYHFDYRYNVNNSDWLAFKLMKEVIDQRAENASDFEKKTLSYGEVKDILARVRETEERESRVDKEQKDRDIEQAIEQQIPIQESTEEADQDRFIQEQTPEEPSPETALADALLKASESGIIAEIQDEQTKDHLQRDIHKYEKAELRAAQHLEQQQGEEESRARAASRRQQEADRDVVYTSRPIHDRNNPFAALQGFFDE